MSQITKTPVQATTGTILRASGLRKSFVMGDARIDVLRGVDVSIRGGEFIAIEGRSGSGKSTLLHILGALDRADAGIIEYAGRDLDKATSAERAAVRNREFGFVFQFYHLLPELNVIENTMLAAMVQHSWLAFRARKSELRERAAAILASLGMDHRLRHRPSQLSGGERQRVAIARALMNQPRVLFADEPTGNLDDETGRQIMSVLEKLHRTAGQTIVMVTHDRALARTADRVLVLREGLLHRAD
ncbi:MAG: ABC transporter ATP-binding protein [Phycisphaerae bacterium]|nr:ABC transporter ATP-binding protein [Phycisphaerae bacterium]MDW8263273.1 ABC transporter ATP-binding protein [Phycisphaerales bacterium]